jgi:hypothetical protein
MSNTNTGGPAFPGKQKALMIQSEHRQIASEYEIEHNGMTLRDYFAARAMQADVSAETWGGAYEATALQSYAIADAMLKARNA